MINTHNKSVSLKNNIPIAYSLQTPEIYFEENNSFNPFNSPKNDPLSPSENGSKKSSPKKKYISQYEFFSMSNEKESIINRALEIMILAGKYNGKVFGGFVRNILVPLQYGEKLESLTFKDLDIWFTDESESEKFTFEIKKNLKLKNQKRSEVYTFSTRTYDLFIFKEFKTTIDVVVSKTFPVDDFNINFLSYFFTKERVLEKKSYSFNGRDTVEYLEKSIIEKKVFMLPSYMKKIERRDLKAKFHRKRLERIYLLRGWEVSAEMELPVTFLLYLPKIEV